MTTFADVGATFADLFWGGQLGTFGFPGDTVTDETTWTVQLVSVTPQADAPPVFADLDDLQFAALTVVDELDGPGLCEVVVGVDSFTSTATRARLLDAWRAPVEMWVWRGAEKVFAGPLTSCRGAGKTVNLTALGLLHYLAWMASDEPYVVRSRDQALIVKDLVDYYQALEYGNFGLDTTSLTETGVLRDLTLLADAARTFDGVFSEMGGRSEGFDLWADPSTRQVFAKSPQRGEDLSATLIVDDRHVVASTWSTSFAAGQVATDVIATSAAPGGAALLSRAADASLRALTGRKTTVATFTDISRKATLDAHAAQLVVDLGSQVIAVNSTLVPVDLAYGQVGAGDTVTFDTDLGLGPVSASRRIHRLAASTSAAGERLAVEFV